MKKLILALVAVSTIGTLSAQKKEKEVKYEKIFYKDLKVENSDVTIVVDNAISTDAETKFKLKIVNKTSDFLIYKPEESKFIIDGKEMKPTEKWKIINPNSDNFVTVNIKGAYNKVKSYSYVLDGLYKVSANGKIVEAENFRLPLTKNDFKAGDFAVKVNKLYKESDATHLKLDVTYSGNQMGIVFPDKAAAKLPDGNDYATVKSGGLLSKDGPILLKKGQTESITLNWDRMEGGRAMDMQKVEMIVKFNGTFTEAMPDKMKSETLNMEFDEVMSNEKGK